MQGIRALLLIITLPLLAAIGHDVYLFYENQHTGAPQPPGGILENLSALGFIWTRYWPDSYKWAVTNCDPDTWKVINDFLTLKAVYVTGVIAAVFYIAAFGLYLLRRLLGTDGFGFFDRKTDYRSILSHSRDKGLFHYKKRR